MSAAVDTNLLVYASDEASPRRERARELLDEVTRGPTLLYVFWPVVMCYLRLAKHPGLFEHPLRPATAFENIAALLNLPTVRSPGEPAGFWQDVEPLARDAQVKGNLVPDAHLAALCRRYEVSTFWTHDKDSCRFSGLRVRDPFA